MIPTTSRKTKTSGTLLILFYLLLTILSSCANSPSSSGEKHGQGSKALQRTKVVTGTPTTGLPRCPDASPTASNSANTVSVTVNTSCTIGTSNYGSGLTYIDNSLTETGNGVSQAAINSARGLMHGTIHYANTHIMGWGAPDPWPDPSHPEPTDWYILDHRLQYALDTGATPVISLDEAPWWMKGKLADNGNGTTHALTANEEWATVAYESRILDNKMESWKHLVQRVAERYMAAPYNVRYFQVWNEFKGYYDAAINNFDFTISPGKPDGPNANHGYTYMYNQVYETLMKVATSLNIPTDSVKIGGPYVFMDTWSTTTPSNPSTVRKAYGTFDQRPFDAIQYWLQHKTGAGFVTVDGSLENRDTGKLLSDPFTTAEKFADVVKWIRSLDPNLYPGSTTLPVWLAEWFASPYISGTNRDFDNAVKSYAMAKFIEAGGAVALSWGGSGDGTSDQGYWTPTYPGGGKPLPWYDSVKTLSNDFAAGKILHGSSVSDPQKVAALVSEQKVLLINKTAGMLTVTVNGTAQTLTPYQVIDMDLPH